MLHGGIWCYAILRLCSRLLHGVDTVLQGVSQCYMLLHSVKKELLGVTWCYTVLTYIVVLQDDIGCHTVVHGVI